MAYTTTDYATRRELKAALRAGERVDVCHEIRPFEPLPPSVEDEIYVQSWAMRGENARGENWPRWEVMAHVRDGAIVCLGFQGHIRPGNMRVSIIPA